MPQKKNLDVVELVRAKTGRVYGNLMSLLTVMKGLPLSYNRDMQEDKVPLFDTIDSLNSILGILPELLSTMKVNKDKMKDACKIGFMNATEIANYLVKKGIPFRKAHGIVKKIVSECIKKGKKLEDLSLKELKKFSPRFSQSIFKILK